MQAADTAISLEGVPRLSVEGISKAFRGGIALHEVSFDVQRGESHALAGYNGAGKSTLVHILSGAQRPDAGIVRLDGDVLDLHSPHDAQKAGIFTIYQELSLVPSLSVSENIFLGDLPKRRTGAVDWPRAHRAARDHLGQLRVDLDVTRPVGSLPLAHRQFVELAKAMRRQAKVILFDEPTAALQHRDTERLFEVLTELKSHGVSLLYISHRMDELQEICDRVTVLRDGEKVGTFRLPETPSSQIIEGMAGGTAVAETGRRLDVGRTARKHDGAAVRDVAIAVRDLHDGEALSGISFELERGEILAITGRAGSGQSNLAECLFGMRSSTAGSVRVDGTPLQVRTPIDAVRAGIGLVPEERKSQGLVLGMSVLRNITLAALEGVTRVGIIRRGKERAEAARLHRQLRIKGGLDEPVGTLSGGNQQKVVIAKWLLKGARVLLLVEPTRGIDVNAKAEIWNAVYTLAEGGTSILVVTSEINDAAMCDRAIVLSRGRVVGSVVLADLDTPHTAIREMIG